MGYGDDEAETPREDELEDLAEALADGRRIDWARVHARLVSLELLSTIGMAFRAAAQDESDTRSANRANRNHPVDES